MKKTIIAITALTLNFLSFNQIIQPVLAQSLELEIMGGGYKLRGPDQIAFPTTAASFAESTSILNFADIEMTEVVDPADNPTGMGGLIIIDENGGNEFDVTVSATPLSYSVPAGPTVTIPQSNFLIRNYDDTNTTFTILDGNSQTSDFQLTSPLTNADVDGYSSFANGTITLFHGYGKVPSRIKIFPSLKIIIPEAQRPGTYSSILTFTIA